MYIMVSRLLSLNLFDEGFVNGESVLNILNFNIGFKNVNPLEEFSKDMLTYKYKFLILKSLAVNTSN